MRPYKRYIKYTPYKYENITEDRIKELCDEDQYFKTCLLKKECCIKLIGVETRNIGNVREWRERRFKSCHRIMLIIGDYKHLDNLLEETWEK